MRPVPVSDSALAALVVCGIVLALVRVVVVAVHHLADLLTAGLTLP